LFSDNASVLSPHDIAKKYENRRANFESTYLNGNDYNIENNTNIATSTIKRDIQLATTVTIMPTIKTVVQGEPVVSITNENVENDIIENTSTEIIDGEDLAFNLDALSISDSSHITNLKRAVSVFTDNLKQNIDDVKSEQYVSDPDLGESDGDELLRKDGQIWAPGKLNGFVQKKLSTLKSVSPSITTEGNENANYITVAEYRRPPYETIERLIKLDPDFLKHRFDAYFLC
jgi:glutaredoxin-related protein